MTTLDAALCEAEGIVGDPLEKPWRLATQIGHPDHLTVVGALAALVRFRKPEAWFAVARELDLDVPGAALGALAEKCEELFGQGFATDLQWALTRARDAGGWTHPWPEWATEYVASTDTSPRPDTELEGLFILDAILAKHLPMGRDGLIKAWKDNSSADLWSPIERPDPSDPEKPYRPHGWARIFAKSVWNTIEPKWREQEEKANKNPAAWPAVVHKGVINNVLLKRPTKDPNQVRILMEGDTQPVMHAAALAHSQFGSIYAHHLIRFLVFEAHARWIKGEPDARTIRVKGGYDSLAKVLNLKSKSAPRHLRDLIEELDSTLLVLNGPNGNSLKARLLTKESGSHKAGKGKEGYSKHSYINLILGTPLFPGYVHKLKDAEFTEEEYALVPVFREIPPLLDSPRTKGAQATFSMLIPSELRLRAQELRHEGGVLLNVDQLADRAHLPRPQASDLLKLWSRPDDRDAYLTQVKRGRYTLGPKHERELRFILDGGERQSDGRKRGQASARKRAEARANGQASARKPSGARVSKSNT